MSGEIKITKNKNQNEKALNCQAFYNHDFEFDLIFVPFNVMMLIFFHILTIKTLKLLLLKTLF